jgi:hypothetical protein
MTLTDLLRINAALAAHDGLLTLDELVDQYTERFEADQWDRESDQLLWAEAGGYRSGLARPV